MNMLNAQKYSYSSLYVITCALATVLIDNLVNNLSPLVVLFYVTLIAVIYFHVINFGKMVKIYKLFARQYKTDFLLINFLIAILWLCTYYGNYYSSATIFNYLLFFTLGMISRFKSVESIRNNLLRIALGLALIALPFFIYTKQTTGALLAVVGGVFVLLYNTATYKMTTKTNITASQTLAIRFWGLLIILAILPATQLNIHALDWITILKIFILAFLSFILQIWLAQKGLYSVGVKSHGLILSLTPLATLILQCVLLHQWYWQLLIMTLISPFILNDILWETIIHSMRIRLLKKLLSPIENED